MKTHFSLLSLLMTTMLATAAQAEPKATEEKAIRALDEAATANSPAAVVRVAPSKQAAAACLQENVTISINFAIRAKSFAEARTKYDEKMQQLADFAKQQNIGKFELQSMNYSVNAQPSYDNGVTEPGYQLSGNASYQLDTADSAFKLGEFLAQHKFQVSVNVNKYRGGACNNPIID